MRKHIITVLLSIGLFGFIALAVTNIQRTNTKLKFEQIEVKSNEAKLIELNIKYDQLLKQKTNTDSEKQDQLNKIQELENERKRLEGELKAKRNKESSDRQKLAVAAQKASGTAVASASGGCADWMAQAGIPQTQATNKLILKESGCNPRAVNPTSGACGIPQAWPCSKLPNGVNTDPVTQLRWMDNYVKVRYGSWDNALATWYSRCGSAQGCWY
jgi:hypothetical protein